MVWLQVYMAYILMEWVMNGRSKEDLEKNIPHMIDVLTHRKYIPMSFAGQNLSLADWQGWPNDMLWKHTEAPDW